jgi:hypothetical protein
MLLGDEFAGTVASVAVTTSATARLNRFIPDTP